MSDSKLSSINNYIVNNISKIDANTSITKRPYGSTPFSSGKRDDKSKSSKGTSKSSVSKKSSNSETNDFSDLISNELNDKSILANRETSRIINTNFHNASSNKTDYNAKNDSSELHSKLRDAMSVEIIDTSELYKKLQLLNVIKSNSNK